ncbi:MAG TPA: phosphoribosyltransferase family protein [Pirellulales bacterium]|jgi:orotate phosphoribosyltransferase
MSDTIAQQRAEETRATFVACNAILTNDHFVYISGQHGSGWIDKDAIFVEPQRIRRLTSLLADAVRARGAEILCGPATGGLIVAQWTAHALGLPAVFTEHAARPAAAGPAAELRGNFVLRRGYDALVANRRVLIVDDVINSGHSLRQTAQAVRSAGGNVIGAAALVHRGNVDAAGIGVEYLDFLLEYDIAEWPAANCPLCQQRVPVNCRYAHGQDFLKSQCAPPAADTRS